MALADLSALELFRIVADEFSAVSDDNVGIYFELAAQTISVAVFEPVYKQAVVYLAAHLLSMDTRASASGGSGGAVGPITGERAGEVSINYGYAGNSGGAGGAYPDGLDTTVYGRRFIALRRAMPGTKPLSAGQRIPTW